MILPFRPVTVNGKFGPVERMKFIIDDDIPVFSSEECNLFAPLAAGR